MATILSILIVIVCVLLILVVLVQNSKGGGLTSSFSSTNQVMGVRKTADFLEKATWTLAAGLLVLSLLLTSYNNPSGDNGANGTSKTKNMSSEDAGIPATKTPAPATPAPGTNPAPAEPGK